MTVTLAIINTLKVLIFYAVSVHSVVLIIWLITLHAKSAEKMVPHAAIRNAAIGWTLLYALIILSEVYS